MGCTCLLVPVYRYVIFVNVSLEAIGQGLIIYMYVIFCTISNIYTVCVTFSNVRVYRFQLAQRGYFFFLNITYILACYFKIRKAVNHSF